MLEGFDDKRATAQCIIGYMSAEMKEPLVFVGETQVMLLLYLGNYC